MSTKAPKNTVDHSLTQAEMFEPGASVSILRREPQPPYPMHDHDFPELVIVFGGRGTHVKADYQYRLQPGDVFVIQADEAHAYTELEDLCLINILYEERLADAMQDLKTLNGFHWLFSLEPTYRKQDSFTSHLRLNTQQLTHIMHRVETMEDELSRREIGFSAALESHFRLIVTDLVRWYTAQGTTESKPLTHLADVITYMQNHYDKPIALEELASMGAMSVSTLVRNFKKVQGQTPIDYLLQLRLEKSSDLLRYSEHNMTQIARLVGMPDSNYFARQFKRRYGVSPRDYRQSTRSDT